MRIIVLLACLAVASAAEWPDFIPPADSGVVNVKDYGAVGDGKTDDTEAIRTAISENIDKNRYSAPPMIWLPAGTYLVSAPIEGRQYKDLKGWSFGWRAGFLLVGQSRTKSVLKLKDACDGYTDAAKPRHVVATGSEMNGGGANEGGGGNQAFRHLIANLTVDVGTGNPGADGIDFIANNRGSVENVLIRAPAGSGRTGLVMDRHWPGPALIKQVEIQGFATGISMAGHWQYSMTFEDIVLKDQAKLGIFSEHNPIFMRKLTASGAAPVIRIKEGDQLLVLLDATITGKDTKEPAIATPGIADVRGLSCTGYASVIDGRDANDVKSDDPTKATKLASWRQGHQVAAVEGTAKPLSLPVEETPLWWARSEQDWVNGAGDVQKALDSGTAIVYLPNGVHEVDKTLVIKGTTKKVVGFQSCLKMKKGVAAPLLRIEGSASVIFEHLWMEGGIEHAGTGTVTFRHCDFNNLDGSGGGLHASGAGKTFIEDVIGRVVLEQGHRLWARQINAEFGEGPLQVNNGGTMWVLGYKTEADPGTISLKQTGGASEILGAILYPLHGMRGDVPAWLIEDGRFSGSWVYNNKWYAVHVRHQGKDIKTNMGRGPALWSTEVE